MCGIAGYASLAAPAPDRKTLHRMCGTLVHRGPDDLGCEIYRPGE